VADDAVLIAPVSVPNSLVTGKCTGNFAKIATFTMVRTGEVLVLQALHAYLRNFETGKST